MKEVKFEKETQGEKESILYCIFIYNVLLPPLDFMVHLHYFILFHFLLSCLRHSTHFVRLSNDFLFLFLFPQEFHFIIGLFGLFSFFLLYHSHPYVPPYLQLNSPALLYACCFKRWERGHNLKHTYMNFREGFSTLDELFNF